MKLANTLEALALQIDQKATMALSDIRNNRTQESRQKFLDIQFYAWSALNDLDGQRSDLTELNITYKDIPLRVLMGDDEMFVYIENTEITDILMSSTLAGIEAVVKQALIQINTEDGQ